MGRSFVSIHRGITLIAERWAGASLSQMGEDSAYGGVTAGLAMRQTSGTFVGYHPSREGVPCPGHEGGSPWGAKGLIILLVHYLHQDSLMFPPRTHTIKIRIF